MSTQNKKPRPYQITYKRGADAGTIAEAVCIDCNAKKEVRLNQHLTIPKVIKKFEQDGWVVMGHNKNFMCPACANQKPADAGTVGEVTQPQTHYHDPTTGETGHPRGIMLKCVIKPSAQIHVRIPVETYRTMGEPERIKPQVTDDGMLVLRKAGPGDGIGVYKDTYGDTRRLQLSRKWLPSGATPPHKRTGLYRLDGYVLPSQKAIVIPIKASRITETITERAEPRRERAKTVHKSREDTRVVPLNTEVGTPLPSQQEHDQLLAEGRDLRVKLNAWIRRCNEAGKRVNVNQEPVSENQADDAVHIHVVHEV